MISRLLTLLLFFSLLSCKVSTSSDQDYTVYLVRHAEKVIDKSRDPILTSEGMRRAKRLAELMSDNDIEAIYSTDYQRTTLTAKPFAEEIGIDIQLYDPRDLPSLVARLKSLKHNALVVGHSNSTPTLANLILGEDFYENFKEDQYDQIIKIECSKARIKREVLSF